jgi:FG-GAP-like repeat/Right handed beta helix region
MSSACPLDPVVCSDALRATARNSPAGAGKLWSCLVVLAVCWLMPGAARAATFVVNAPWDGVDVSPGDGVCETVAGTGICTLRAAVMEANRMPGSTVDLTSVPGGMVLLSIPASGADDETTGDLNIRADMTIVGGGPLITTIDANRAVTSARAFHVGAVTAAIAGVTIRNGHAGASGGGLYLAGGAVFITDCVITGNQAGNGGGIYQAAGAATIERTTIDGNRAIQFGGGIMAAGESMQIGDSAVTRNEAGLAMQTRGYGGGGIAAAAGLTTIQNVTISGNEGYDAGGIMVRASTRVFNSTITFNGAAGPSKFWPGQGGGVSGAPLSFQNTILAGKYETYWDVFSGPRSTGNDCRGNLLSEGNNLIGTISDCNITGPIRLVTNFGLGPLQNNGGPTATHALLPGSDAIDGGAPDGCRDALGSPIPTDQRGAPRPFGAACDIGAFESTTCTYSPGAPSVLRIPDTGSSGELPILPNDGRCAWSTASSVAWIVVTTGGSGSGNGTVAYTVLPNPGGARRGAMTIAGQSFTVLQASHEGARVNFDGDNKTDITVYRPSTGTWFTLTSSSGFVVGLGYAWGANTDVPVPADYDGDSRTDVAVYRPSTGHWFILKSSTAFTTWDTYQWGTVGDVPVPGDYDGDGKTDVAIYRPPTGMWFILQSSTGFTGGLGYGWGASGDVPVPSDYDGDGSTDIAIYRPSTAYWFILKSSSHFAAWDLYQCGSAQDIAVPADYDGDVKADLAVYQPSSGVWHILHSSTGFTDGQDYTWGLSDDVPVPGDYDGDGAADIAVYRPSTAHWFILKSSTTFTTWDTYQWGSAGDVPIPRHP